jgi:carotenoid cleavage dioxygenase-like enzyme
VLDAAGSVEASVPLDLPRPVMMHDMAISKNYAIFLDLPLVFDGEVRCCVCLCWCCVFVCVGVCVGVVFV